MQSLNRALDLVEALGNVGTAGLTLKAVSHQVGLNASTAHNLLSSLLVRGYVEQDPVTGRYLLGPGALTLAYQFNSHCDLTALAAPFLRRLHAQFDEYVELGVLRGRRLHGLIRIQSSQPLIVNPQTDGDGDLHFSSSGKVLLSGLDPTDLDVLLAGLELRRYTPYTITDQVQLAREVAQVRERGYATQREEHFEGLAGAAAPAYDATGRLVGAVGLAYPILRTTPEREAAIIRGVRLAAANISERLGYRPTRTAAVDEPAAASQPPAPEGAGRAGSEPST